MYFNLSNIATRTQIFKADLILHRGQASFRDMLLYQQSYGLLVKDVNTSKVIYNRTIAKDDGLCMVNNLLNTVKRWRNYPNSNEGLLLSVKDAGRYSTSLQTFYPKKNIKVPALALYISSGKIFLRRYKLIPSKSIQILSTETRRGL